MQEFGGYIKLYRSLIDWGWYRDSVVKDLFLHLLLSASFKHTQWQGVDLMPGQVITGRKRLAECLGFSERQIRTALKKLEKTGEIILNPTNRYTLITIVHWQEYQRGEETDGRPHIKNVNNKNISGTTTQCVSGYGKIKALED